MWTNYLKIAFRQLWRNRLFSLLNIVGLTVGLAVSTFIGLYVWHEFHYDNFHPLSDRTYRMLSVAKFGDQEVNTTGLHESFGREAKQQVPEIENIVRYAPGLGPTLLAHQDKAFKEEWLGFADASLLSVMGFPLEAGDARTALAEPGSIVLTKPLAKKYFGDENPLGQTVVFDKKFPLTVSGVLAELPTNTVFHFNALLSLSSMPTLGPKYNDIFEGAGFLQTFLVLRPDAKVARVEKKMATVKSGLEFVDASAKIVLEPLPNLHLDSRANVAGTRTSLYIFLTIALVILALAIINYISLTTARATQRAREVGIRKAVGGLRSELIGQFFGESFLTTTLAFGLSLCLLMSLFTWTNAALDLRMDSRILGQSSYWLLMLGLWLGCALLAGSYPALLLSGFQPQEVLKGNRSAGQSGARVRQFFTTVQFAASVGLLVCSFVIFAQMRYMRTKNLGIDRAQVVAISVDADMASRFLNFREQVRQRIGNENVSVTDVGLFSVGMTNYFLETKETNKQMMVSAMTVDQYFFKALGIRWVNIPVGWGKRPVAGKLKVYNQTVVRETGLKGDPLLQPDPFKNTEKPVDGIVADFNLGSLRNLVAPMMLTVVSDTNRSIVQDGGYLLVKLGAHTDVPTALSQLKALYEAQQPTTPFDYYFLDDAYNTLYAKEDRLAQLFNAFTGLTLLVACLGLLGLMTFNVETRTKEIGVRKVLGASVASIVTLLSKDFLKLVLIAIVVASPIAWYAMNAWLADFAYKIDISWWVFALAGGLAVGIALLTVSFQSVRAALMNPVESLRSE